MFIDPLTIRDFLAQALLVNINFILIASVAIYFYSILNIKFSKYNGNIEQSAAE